MSSGCSQAAHKIRASGGMNGSRVRISRGSNCVTEQKPERQVYVTPPEKDEMSDIDREERIRQRAHEIWERNGRREGSHEADWDQARREIEMEDEDGANLSET